eukprot:TRINITY_DN601_c0_g1_i3.p1 TRINITY_DN601_c0_g1~~TRINITY_DN601_c0_g1_i3.p1  ORF type:complete len:499 (+),score=132.61 TRINITY_DN601_c0_g1_i3:119-1615(+)
MSAKKLFIVFAILAVGAYFAYAAEPTTDSEALASINLELLQSVYILLAKNVVPTLLNGLNINETWDFAPQKGVRIILSNITFNNIQLDPNVTVITRGKDDHSLVLTLKNFDLNLTADLYAKYHLAKVNSSSELILKNVTSVQELAFSQDKDSGLIYLSVRSSHIYTEKSYIIIHKNRIESFIVNRLTEFFRAIFQKRANDIVAKFDELLIQFTKRVIKFNVTDYEVSLWSPVLPRVVSATNGKTFLNLPLNFGIKNVKTGEIPDIQPITWLPPFDPNAGDLQTCSSNSVTLKLLWGVFDSSVVNLTVNDKWLPAGSPVRLNTSFIDILLPGIPKVYGNNLGMYINVAISSKIPDIVIRDGKLVLTLHVQLSFLVDRDSSQYPQRNLSQCTACDEALALNASLFSAVTAGVFQVDGKNNLRASVLNTFFDDVKILRSKVDVDVDLLVQFLNEASSVFVPPINEKIRQGFSIPENKFLESVELMLYNDTLITRSSYHLRS